MQPNPVGAVMVVGGGIAGMQAALDLADQGFKVYLVEEKSAIGGHMAKLDKTFPTNDCAMCNISPKLVDTGRHVNIELLTDTDVVEVAGQAGNFEVKLRRRPRYIDISRCIGCGDCAQVCPVSTPDPYEEGMKTRKAAYKLYAQAVPAAYAIDKIGIAPCRNACPAGQRAQGYIALIAQGRYREAFRVIKEDNPFPSVCGRTCHHPCEGACTRALVDQSVGIMSLKRFVVDYTLAYGRDRVQPVPRTRPEWVAVIGSGPAGLTAAHDLAKQGYGVTVYEALPVAGGMMRVGIPAHRLPKGVLQQDIDDILALGIMLKTSSPIKDPVKLLEQGYNAVCLATGISSRQLSMELEGEESEGVISAATFLRKVNLGEPIRIGAQVAVLGGGITALDSAAVARRLGAEKVYLVLDRPRGELPAYHWEIAAVEAEGIQLLERMVATKVLSKDGKVIGVELAEAAQGMVKDEHGRRRPKIKPGTEIIIEVDTIIGTVGQFSDLNYLEPHFDELNVDPQSLASNIPGLFVVGGRKTGASYIIEAVALGHRVAASIHCFLHGESRSGQAIDAPPALKFSRQEIEQRILKGEITLQPKVEPSMLPMEERVTSFREVVLGLTERQARQEAQRCLQCGVCSECLACVYACGVDAIDHNMVEREQLIQVGAVILAPGYQAYNAALDEEYGLGRFPNVLTALQFERLLSAAGPTMGHVLRPSDGKKPARIAFLQCIGSRDQKHDYCSAVCCMYATKEALIAKEHQPDLDVHVFLMDMRAFSKGYLGYFERARQQYGIQYTHCRISKLIEDPDTREVILDFQDENGKHQQSRFDMAVLSVGMEISESVKQLGFRLGVELDDYGFCHTALFNPLETSRPGIFAVGPFRSPKDIPESVIEASGAAAAAAQRLSPSRFSLSVTRTFPNERDVKGEPARIGVFVCHCGSNIAGFLDVAEVSRHASQLPNVVHAETNLYTCSQDSIRHITEVIQEQNLNRVVVASCSPLTHQSLFQDSLRSAGLNPYLFEMANIRNQCSWVHSHEWEVATQKACELVRMAVAKAALLEAQHTIDVPVQHAVMVVGGGAAGLTAAINLANQGFPVHLVEKQAELGGNLRQVWLPSDGADPQTLLAQLVDEATSDERISIYLNSQVVDVRGFKGNFTSLVQDNLGQRIEIQHGATILATGGEEYRGPDYGYGTDPRILTIQQFENKLFHSKNNIKDINSIAMLLCVGPAERFCSRICCSTALKNAIELKRQFPNTTVTIMFRDIRAYGFKERQYTQARQLGVLFVRYHPDQLPEVDARAGKPLKILVRERTLGRNIEIQPEMLVLSMPVVPGQDVRRLSAMFKVPVDSDGFFMEAHVKLRPVDFSTDGVFMAGMAHYPKLLDESIIQAQAAAGRAARVLSQDTLVGGGRVAVVEPEKCTGCLTCVRICPFSVPQIQVKLAGVGKIIGAAYIEAAICQGCGSCVAECPARAIQLMHYTDAQMAVKVSALLPLHTEMAASQENERVHNAAGG